MTIPLTQLLIGIATIIVAIALAVGFWKYLAAGSERRMRSMLAEVGLDPEIAESGDIPTIMKDVRYRCRRCPVESVCEGWLDGDVDGDNEFCPNHKVFEILKKYS
jgi:hypothetical protein